jgi:mycothiol synthase
MIQLEMVWPTGRLGLPPVPHLPDGYTLRSYRSGDEPRFYEVMSLAGWPGWDNTKLQPWLARIPPRGWFMVIYLATDTIVATAMALHDHSDRYPFGGELGWVAADPAHAGRGLGRAVCAAVTARLIAAGYQNIHLYTEDFRLAALKLYLTLGYVPHLVATDHETRWQVVCQQLEWSFTPDAWQAAYTPIL